MALRRAGKGNQQEGLYRGIYEFEDPSGCLLAARIPHVGSADLYSGTAVVVRPNQFALFVYKGRIADVLGPGMHEIQTGNVPILTKLANWKFGFRSPLRCELWFFTASAFTGRRWGTRQPVMLQANALGVVPIMGYGNYTVRIADPQKLYLGLIGNRSSFDITEVEDYVQGVLQESLPVALQESVQDLAQLSTAQRAVSERLEELIRGETAGFGLSVEAIQVLSLTPSKEVLQALKEKAAMDLIGNKREYMLYKAANGMEALGEGGGDPMRMMMGMMVSKGLMGMDYHDRERAPERERYPRAIASASRAAPADPSLREVTPVSAPRIACPSCGHRVQPDDRFCSRCATGLSS